MLKDIFYWIFAVSLLGTLSCSDDDKEQSSESAATTYDINGSFQPTASLNLGTNSFSKDSADRFGLRTQCTDGFFYSVYCLSFTTPPIAKEGDVNCSENGGFTAAGLPVNEAVGCFIRRYEAAEAGASETIGAVEIPAPTLNGSSDTLVAAGNLKMNISVGSNGKITASVIEGEVKSEVASDAISTAYSPANFNGNWEIKCDSDKGGALFSAAVCKCFLSEDDVDTHYEGSESACVLDGASQITTDVVLPVGMNVYNATVNSALEVGEGQILAAGSKIKAISVWQGTAKGSGGEGVTDLDGALTWDTSVSDPTVDIAWKIGSITVKDGTGADVTFTLPALPANINNATHSEWMTYAKNMTSAAEAQGFKCTDTHPAANAHESVGNTDLNKNMDCIRQVLSSIDEDHLLPRVDIEPLCANNGCFVSSDATDSSEQYYHADVEKFTRIHVRGREIDYPHPVTTTSDFSALSPEHGISVEPRVRFVFEPLELYASGAGFRQGDQSKQHYDCKTAGGTITNAACSDAMKYYELQCDKIDELAIKFIGTTSPLDMVFDTHDVVVNARLVAHGEMGPQDVTPTGTTALALCKSVSNTSGSTFYATATKQVAE